MTGRFRLRSGKSRWGSYNIFLNSGLPHRYTHTSHIRAAARIILETGEGAKFTFAPSLMNKILFFRHSENMENEQQSAERSCCENDPAGVKLT